MRFKNALLFFFLFLTSFILNAQSTVLSEDSKEVSQANNNKKEAEGVSLQKDTFKNSGNIFYIDFIGSGDLQKSFSQGEEFNANTGIGVILERFNLGDEPLIKVFELEARLNVASTSDSIISNIINEELQNRREFGSYVLNPVSRRQSLYLNSNIFFNIGQNSRWKKYFKRVSGVNIRMITSNNVWEFDNERSHLGVLYFRAGIFHEFVPKLRRLDSSGEDYGRTKYSVYFGVNYSWRTIFGDITAENKSDELLAILGTNETSYRGFELNFGFRLNNLRAEFQMPMIRKKSDSVEGLTNTQFLYSIKFIGGFGVKK